MASPVLWMTLLLMLGSGLVPRDSHRRLLAAAGWATFAPFWGSMALFFLGDIPGPEARVDPFNAVLSALMVPFSIYIAWRLLGTGSPVLWKMTRATAFVGLLYFPFTEVPWLRESLIGFTDGLTAGALGLFGVPVAFSPPYLWVQTHNPDIVPDGLPVVEIILACTAIESIALFGGVILAVQADRRRKMLALAAVLPSIYLLNLIRNMFVTTAYAYNWFGPALHSFEVAHTAMAKVGSTLALVGLAYVTFRILPEVAQLIQDIVREFLPARRGRAGPGSA